MSDMKLYIANGLAIGISFTDIEWLLKIVLLLMTIGYTAYKWIVEKNKNDSDGNR